jgi:threonine efflux protein
VRCAASCRTVAPTELAVRPRWPGGTRCRATGLPVAGNPVAGPGVARYDWAVSYLLQLLVLAGVWLVVVIAPGPNFVATVAAATGGGRSRGFRTAVGFALGDLIWASSSVLGLAVVLARYEWIAQLVRFGGAAMLVFLGLRSIVRARRAGAPELAGVEPARRFRSAVLTGVLVDLGNPKAALFFTSLYAALLPAGAPRWLLVASVAVTAAIPGLWYSAVAWLFSTGRVARAYRALRRPVDAVVGAVLVALGLRLAAG